MIETRLLEAVKRPLDDVWDAVGACRRARDRAGARAERRRSSSGGCSRRSSCPAVVDADGLYGLEPFERHAPTVLTPHAGELGRLLGEEAPGSTPTGSRR